MKKIVGSILIILFVSQSSLGQLDLGGKWTGTSNWGLQKYKMVLNLSQEGSLLEGNIEIETVEKTKSAIYTVSGFIKNNKIILKGIKFTSKEGDWCIPAFEIKHETSLDREKLIGRWKSNNVKGGCLPGITGKVDLAKSKDATVVKRSVSIAENDRLGNALSKELQKRKYYALIIGVQDYSDNAIVDLDRPVADARALRSVLVDEYTFNPENITFLTNPNRTEIIETFDLLTSRVEATDNLLIFYAGHGIWDEQIEQGYWLPSDAKKSSKAAWLSNGTIRDYIRAIDSKHTLLITDACFSGGILKTREAFSSSKAMLEMYKLQSRKAMTSGTLKTVPDKSVFIEYLIKALQNNEQPLVSADQLFSSFKYNVINNSPNGQVPQYGVISQADDEGGDFLFLKK
ncbi:MAG: caspase family protein [Bacteroidota bacterium]